MIMVIINNDYRVQDNILLLLNDDFCISYQYYIPLLMKFQKYLPVTFYYQLLSIVHW